MHVAYSVSGGDSTWDLNPMAAEGHLASLPADQGQGLPDPTQPKLT